MSNYENLHCHTTNSDGWFSIKEIIQFCEQKGIKAIAFTDHDTILPKSDVTYLKNYTGPVRWVSGTELSVRKMPDSNEDISTLHMVGLFIDPNNKKLQDFCKKAQEARIERMQRIVENLKTIGINITEQDCLEASSGEAVGRPHMVQAIMKYPEHVKVIDDLYEDMLAVAKETGREDLKEKIKAVETYGDRQKPYMLFLSQDSYIPNIYVDYLYQPTWDEAVDAIRAAGGLAILAHYYYSSKKLSLEVVEQMLREDRLDGFEIIYGFGTEIGDNEEEGKIMREQKEKLKEIVKRTHCVVSGGSDAHSREDWELFVKSKNFAEQTEGLLDAILEKHPELEWYKK